MTELLAAVLGFSLGFLIGHRTARIVHVPIGALAAQDQAALLAAERAQFDALTADLDLPESDDPEQAT